MIWRKRKNNREKENVIANLKVKIDAVASGIEIDGREIEIKSNSVLCSEVFLGGCKLTGVYKYELKREPLCDPVVILEFHPQVLKVDEDIKCSEPVMCVLCKSKQGCEEAEGNED